MSDTRPPKNTSGKTVDGVPNNRRKAYAKGDFDTMLQRTEEMVKLLSQCKTEGEIKREFKKRATDAKDDSERQIYDIHFNSFNNYLVRARKLMLARQNRSKADVRADAVSFYEGILADKNSSTKEKMDARIRLDEVFGIDAPKTLNNRVTDGQGAPLKPMVVAPIVQFVIPSNQREKVVNNGHAKEIEEKLDK